MTLPQKLEILIKRKNINKTEIAKMTEITYRALANYISGERRPRKAILAKLSEVLNTTPEFLLDDKQSIILTSEERFVYNANSPDPIIHSALTLLKQTREILSGNMTASDKQAFFSCLTDIYFASKNKQEKPYK